MNVNAGESRREGIETTASANLLEWLVGSLSYARTRATFRNGPNEGNDVPLVPRDRLGATIDVFAPRGVRGRVDYLHSGSQVLSNDDANGQERLDAYDVVNARVTVRPYETLRPRGGSTSQSPRIWTTLELFVEGRNLFDEAYATRGIYAFDFANNVNSIFVTPAPGRTYAAGLSMSF
jgi:outer membrane receptor protein involved in Fe transport